MSPHRSWDSGRTRCFARTPDAPVESRQDDPAGARLSIHARTRVRFPSPPPQSERESASSSHPPPRRCAAPPAARRRDRVPRSCVCDVGRHDRTPARGADRAGMGRPRLGGWHTHRSAHDGPSLSGSGPRDCGGPGGCRRVLRPPNRPAPAGGYGRRLVSSIRGSTERTTGSPLRVRCGEVAAVPVLPDTMGRRAGATASSGPLRLV